MFVATFYHRVRVSFMMTIFSFLSSVPERLLLFVPSPRRTITNVPPPVSQHMSQLQLVTRSIDRSIHTSFPCFYRGAAGDGVSSPAKGINESMKLKSEAADKEIRERHFAMPNATETETAVEVRRKRLIYRSKQRGWLEGENRTCQG